MYFHSVDAPLIALQTSDYHRRKAQKPPSDVETDSDTIERTKQDKTIRVDRVDRDDRVDLDDRVDRVDRDDRDDRDDVLDILSIAYM